MNESFFHDPAWYRATELVERIATLRAGAPAPGQAEAVRELARRRLQRWRAQSPFSDGELFAQRLAIDGIAEDDLLYLLGEPAEVLRCRVPAPGWLAELEAAFAMPRQAGPHPPDRAIGQDTAAFLEAIEPLIAHGRDRLRAGIETLIAEYPAAPLDIELAEAALADALPARLLVMLGRTMVLELHVARVRGLLEGETGEARFQSFIARLRRPEIALALLQEYPVLARQLVACIDAWATAGLELLERLCADWEAIRAHFSPDSDPGPLTEIAGGDGDRHRGGRVVQILTFRSGFQVVYKPKSLAVDRHFQELLAWLNARGDHPPFRTLGILDRGTYGWVEFIAARGCRTPEEVQRFYERQGGYLALLYALEATDFHSENLIAAGEHPVLVDLEALFHPYVERPDPTQATAIAGAAMAFSVLRVGLLPQRSWIEGDFAGVDLSGLASIEGQLSPQPIPQWDALGTDEMHLVRRRLRMRGKQNRPTLDGADVNLLEYAGAIVVGFTRLYQLLLEHRDALLADDGPLARFAGDEVRVVVRPTQVYGRLLQESFHPDLLRNALDRDRFFDRLWVGAERRPYLARVIAAERADLLRGDIPMFAARPGARDLWSSAGERIADLLDEPGIALAQRRLRQLGAEDLTRQLWFVRASLSTLAPGVGGARRPRYQMRDTQQQIDSARLLAAARSAGERIGALALHGAEDVAWIGVHLTRGDSWLLAPLGADLYDGVPGIALFLGYLGALTHEERYTVLARTALTTIRRQIDDMRPAMTSIGAFDGWGGLIYALTHLGALWDQPELLAEAEALVELLPALIARDESLDIISGAAGCIGSLLSLHRCRPSERTLAAAIQAGDRLLARAQPIGQGIGWTTRVPVIAPLTGFSHGASGMAWALLELAAHTGAERFQAAALAAIAYERGLFSPEAGNWPDLRDPIAAGMSPDERAGGFRTMWCHGAPGIGLARLRVLRHLDDPALRADLDAALRTTLAGGFGYNHSLCHGDLGNLDLLSQAGDMLDDPRWRAETGRIAAGILESIGSAGWLCGVPLAVETPGLMTGLAGIGYGLLRLAQPARVPSVLTLDPPLG